MYRTNSGIPAKYFNGMAMPKSKRKEIPSNKAERCK
jgi:hypothetical protein